MFNFILGLMLYGLVSNIPGRSGVYIWDNGIIIHVYRCSPAFEAGIKEGDKVIGVDDHKGREGLDGTAGELIHIHIKRGNQPLDFWLVRRDCREVHD